MLPFEPPATAEEATAAVTALSDATWVLAAIVDVLDRGVQATYGPDDLPARVLAASGLFEEEGGSFRPAPGVATLFAKGAGLRDAARSVLGQVAAVAKGQSPDQGWAQQDDETLLAQGAASAGLVALLLPVLFRQLPEVEERLRSPGARFLDVGVGVGAMTCAIAAAVPSLSIVGVDPFARALRLASRLVAERGLEARVSLLASGVEDLEARDAFDVAWVPAPFVPPGAFTAGIANLARAVRPGGWILVGMGRLEKPGVSTEVTRWQTALIGGTPLTPGAAEALLADAGFSDVVVVETPPGAPVVVAARRRPGG